MTNVNIKNLYGNTVELLYRELLYKEIFSITNKIREHNIFVSIFIHFDLPITNFPITKFSL